MKIVRGIAVALALIAAGFAAVAVTARFSDGPIGFFPGGPLLAGEFIVEWPDDWTFAESIREVELQLYGPDRSRRTWILVHEGSAFIPCGLPNLSLLKQWPHQAMADGRALVRVDAKRYAADLVRVEDPALVRELGKNLRAKYDSDFDGEVWYFRLIEPAPETPHAGSDRAGR